MYDKQAAHIGYVDSSHTYVNINSKEKYTSVTTLIHKFVPPFKSTYWSLYKAIKDTLPYDVFSRYKRAAGGWEKVVSFYNKNNHLSSHRVKIELRQAYYLDKWNRDRDNACELGSAIHAELEGAAHQSQQIKDNKIIHDVSQENILAIQDFTTNRVYPELLIFNDEYAIAGQADKIFKHGNIVDIHDYKTCKEISTTSFREETLLAPFTNIPNANYYIYQLQLSMYGFMLEECGYKVGKLYMHWIYGDNPETSNVRDKVKTFEMDYRPDIVKQMMQTNIF